MIELYQFIHCPYCIRVRLALGFLNLKYQSFVVPYDNVDVPMQLIGVKKLPIVKLDSGLAMGESLDIIRTIDVDHRLESMGRSAQITEVAHTLDDLAQSLHPLAIPHWILFPEFDESSRAYFLKKQEKKRGSLAEIMKSQDAHARDLPEKLSILKPYLDDGNARGGLNIVDIIIAAHLYPIYLIREGAFMNANIEKFLNRVSTLCSFNYFEHAKEPTSYVRKTEDSIDRHVPYR